MNYVRALVMLSAVGLSACSGSQGSLPAGSQPAARAIALPQSQSVDAEAASVEPETAAQWGVGYYAASTLYDWSKAFCEVPGDTLPEECPEFKPAKRTASYSVSKSVHQAGAGEASIQNSARVALGTITFNLSASDTVPADELSFRSSNGLEQVAWQDVLTPVSSTLKKGTAVQFAVTLSVSPSTTNVPCYTSSPAQGSFNFGASGNDGTGDELEVLGSCPASSPGPFSITNGAGQVSTTDSGTLSGRIGEPTIISGFGAAGTYLPCIGSCFPGVYTVGLGATVTYTITSNTPGVTFKTASGATY